MLWLMLAVVVPLAAWMKAVAMLTEVSLTLQRSGCGVVLSLGAPGLSAAATDAAADSRCLRRAKRTSAGSSALVFPCCCCCASSVSERGFGGDREPSAGALQKCYKIRRKKGVKRGADLYA